MSTSARLQRVCREVFDDEDLTVFDQTTARDVEGWDSLSHVRLMVAVEREFGVRFSIGEVSGLDDVGALRRLLEGKLAR